MSSLEVIALAAAAAWLAVISLVTLLNVRQIAILTVRADRTSFVSADEDGLPLGFDVPLEVTEAIPETANTAILILLSATCGPCREVAATLDTVVLPDPITALVTGPDDPRQVMTALLPATVTVIEDPDAARLAGLLNLRSSPFALRVSEGTIVGKAYVSEAQTLERLYASAGDDDPESSRRSTVEVIADVN